ncbi:MAG: hypothetical protein EXQ85_10495 [Alphaproteobacteria bacterium]|nr:hypothetical protein [Alphaproteobacteria bacterium]
MSLLSRLVSLFFPAVAFAALAASVLTPVHAQSLHQMDKGTVVSGVVKFADKQIPLPPGDWVVVAKQAQQATVGGGSSASGGETTATVWLAQLMNGKLSGAVLTRTNLLLSPGGWARETTVCGRRDTHFAYSDQNYNPKEIDCWVVNHFVMTMPANASEGTVEFYRWLAEKGGPGTMLGQQHQLVRGGDYLSVTYYDNPEPRRFPPTPPGQWQANPWHRDQIRGNAEKLAHIAQLTKDGEQRLAQLKQAIYVRLPKN